MKAHTQNRVRQVQTFSRVARWVCSGFLAAVLMVSLWAIYSILAGPTDWHFRIVLGQIAFTGDQIDTLALKVWLTLLVGVGLCITARLLWLLHGLFGNLARGEIYTQGNAQRLRSVGWLVLACACLQVLVPLLTIMLLATRIIDWSQATHTGETLSAATVASFVVAGVIMLVSWIMDVGLEVSEEAETLRREAELVV